MLVLVLVLMPGVVLGVVLVRPRASNRTRLMADGLTWLGHDAQWAVDARPLHVRNGSKLWQSRGGVEAATSQ